MPESPPPSSHSASILLVDDHPANVVALEAILAPLGHELVTASSGEEALRQLLRRDFALILLDVQMAGLDGFQTASLIKQRPRSRYIPIIFITAVGRDAAHVFRGYSEGAVDYLVKPFDPDILRSKTQVFVELYLKEEQLKAQAKLLREHERDALLRAGEERYRHLLDVMPQSIWASDAQGNITFWNRAGLQYLGHESGAVTGESLWSALHPEDRASVREAFEEGFALKEAFELQIRLRRASDGSYRWHLARVVPERGSDGADAITGWIATATDIDDQKKAEQVLREAIGLREDFLSVASHELRTPLTSLRLEVENLLRFARRNAGETTGDVIMRTERIDAQAARLNHLIDELLDVSRIAAGRLELKIEEVDLVAVVDEVRTRLGDEARRRGCVLDVRGLERAVGAWDASRLDQVITNLLSNAIKYGAGKPVEITVDVTGDRAVLAVHDHGLGIPAEDQDRIFRRFERAASSRNYAGIGLGLWIVKQIVDALGGTVTVDSRPELGATFTVELPRTRPPGIAARANAASARAEARRGAN
ncbi:MAG TPA: ATP-binding protein [Polyangia bacterium]|nr:ATP-binding protein [Polyangia bacterium]